MGNIETQLCRSYIRKFNFSIIQRHPLVLFAGYRVCHPLKSETLFKIQTLSHNSLIMKENITLKPIDAFKWALELIIDELAILHDKLYNNKNTESYEFNNHDQCILPT